MGYAKRIREINFASHFELGLHIYDALYCIIYMQEYRSGHNEAVLKTVRPKATGVRIPLPAPKNKDTPCGCPLFFATVRGSRTPLCDSLSRKMGFAYPTRRSKSSLFRCRVWVSSPLVNTPLSSLLDKLEFDALTI